MWNSPVIKELESFDFVRDGTATVVVTLLMELVVLAGALPAATQATTNGSLPNNQHHC
jgi:hypothetical protein